MSREQGVFDTVADKIVAVTIIMPILITIAIVTVLLCAAYFVGRYGDEMLYGVLFLLQII